MKQWSTIIICFILTAAAVFGLYRQTLTFEFVLDDQIVVTENKFVQKGKEGLAEIFGSDFMTGYLGKQPDLLTGGRYRPLSLAVFAVAWDYFGLNPRNYHLLNLLFYLICCTTVCFSLERLFFPEKENRQKMNPFLLLATLLFAVHPIHTEVVANVKGLDEILAFLFGILALWFTLLSVDTKKPVWMFPAGISLFLSFLAKESTLPLVLAIPVALWFFRNAGSKTVTLYAVVLFIPAAVYLYIRYRAMGFLLNNDITVTGIMNNPYIDAAFSQKYGTIFFTLLLYLKLLFFPHPLTHDYYPYHIQLRELYSPMALLALAVVASLIWLAVKGIRKREKMAYIIFFFFVTLSIVSNAFINVGTFMNERFMFVPSFVVPLLVVYAGINFSANKNQRTVLLSVLFLFFTGFVYKSWTRIPDWENEMTLNSAAVKVSKNSTRANCFYAVSLYDEIRAEANPEIKLRKTMEAQKYIGKSLEIYPEYADALRMRAGLAAEEYKIDKDVVKLLQVFREILNVRHISYVDEFTNWLEPRTDRKIMADYYFDVGYSNFGVKKQNLNLASLYLQKGYKLYPDHPKILTGNCIISYLTGNYAKATGYGNEYLSKFGENAEVLYYLGHAQIQNNQPEEGRKNLNRAYALNPELKNRKTN